MRTSRTPVADTILSHGTIHTLDATRPLAQAVAIRGGEFLLVGSDAEALATRGPDTRLIDLRGRVVIPGLNDSHIHVIRGGLHHDLELRWDGIPSLADALAFLPDQARRTPPGQWVRVVGGWSEFQFAERRMPTLDEINAAAPAKGPTPPPEQQANSTRHFMRELNRLGLTSIIDAGGGFQRYPEDHEVVARLHRENQLAVRMAYNLSTQRPGHEREDFARWIEMTAPGAGDAFYRMNGAGEMLVFSAADFEDFLEPRPDLPATLEEQLRKVVTALARNRWLFRLHATSDESITRFLDVFEAVHREVPLPSRWFFDHAETVRDRILERIKALGGGIAIQHRMAYQGGYFVARYGAASARRTPPVRRMLAMGIPVGAGTDATRMASYNPWVALR